MAGPRFIQDSDDEDHDNKNPSPVVTSSVSPTCQRIIDPQSSPLSKLCSEEASTGSTGKNINIHLSRSPSELTKRRRTKSPNQRCSRQPPQVLFRWATINYQVVPLVSPAIRISCRLSGKSQKSHDGNFRKEREEAIEDLRFQSKPR